MNNKVQTGIYVIDEEYRIIYLNDAERKLFPEAEKGQHCYQVFCKEKDVCRECLFNGKTSDAMMTYNAQLDQWLEIKSGEIEWPGCDNARIVFSTVVNDGSKILIQNPENLTAYDERFTFEQEYDSLTGLRTKPAFLKKAEEILRIRGSREYCLVAIDIEHFKLFNDWFGYEEGDRFLKAVSGSLKKLQEAPGRLAGYMGRDDFVLLMERDDSVIKALEEETGSYVRQFGIGYGFLPLFGIYGIEEGEYSVGAMYDCAIIAQESIRGNYARRIAWYDSAMKQRMAEDQQMLSEIQNALKNMEFTFALQPICSMISGKVLAMEALIRWNHPEQGTIMPGKFISLLEKNGFITRLDLYVWDLVCAQIRQWLDEGLRTVPVSINVSRADVYAVDLAETFRALEEKYNLKPLSSFLAVEITESAYVQDAQIMRAVDSLRGAGFRVYMDDFGSGYSSLNILKDIHVDVLKIDAKFLDIDEESMARGSNILETIVNMANIMNMKLVVEGVEDGSQAEFLRSIGCIYAQGYHFYRPMAREQIRDLLKDEVEVDYRGLHAKKIERLDINEMLHKNIVSSSMIDNILGGVAIYDLYEGELELLQVNDQYFRELMTDPVELMENRRNILDYVYEDDKEAVLHAFSESRKKTAKGEKVIFRRNDIRCGVVWAALRIFFLKEQDGHQLFYGAVQNITDQKEQEEALAASQKSLESVLGLSGYNKSFLKLADENRRMAASIVSALVPGGMVGGYCEPGFPLYFANDEMVRMQGYSSYEDFERGIGGLIANTIHPDDLEAVAQVIGDHYYCGLEYTVRYRTLRKDGSWFWTMDKGRVVNAEDGRLAIVSACMDISASMAIQAELEQANIILNKKNQELNFLANKLPGGYHHCANTPEYDLLYISSGFLKMFGYTREEIHELFHDKFLYMIHPDDREYVQQSTTGKEGIRMEYRMKAKSGYIWVTDQTELVVQDGNEFFYGVLLDITETVILKEQIANVLENSPGDIFSLTEDGFYFYSSSLLDTTWTDKRAVGNTLSVEEVIQAIYPEDQEMFAGMIAAAVRNGQDVEFGFRLQGADGVLSYLEITITKIPSETEAFCFFGIVMDVTAKKLQEMELYLAKRQLESIIRQAQLNVWEWELDERRVLISAKEEGELVPHVVEDFPDCFVNSGLLPESYREKVVGLLDSVRNGGSMECELPIQTKEGRIIWMKNSCEAIQNASGRPVKAVGYLKDITEEKLSGFNEKEDLRLRDSLWGSTVYDLKVNLTKNVVQEDTKSQQWLMDNGCDGMVKYTEVMDKVIQERVLPEYQALIRGVTSRENLMEQFQNGISSRTVEYQRFYHGRPYWMQLIYHLMRLDDLEDIYGYIYSVDINDKKLRELELLRKAQLDELTGLYNRHTAIPLINNYLKQFPRESAALVMFDLDNFKNVNDQLGHLFGDQVLAENAGMLKRYFRSDDVVCRIGGDEFMVLCRNISRANMRARLEKIIHEMRRTYHSGSCEIICSLSAGYAMVPEHGRAFQKLYKKADTALFEAKRKGKFQFMEFDGSMDWEMCQKSAESDK